MTYGLFRFPARTPRAGFGAATASSNREIGSCRRERLAVLFTKNQLAVHPLPREVRTRWGRELNRAALHRLVEPLRRLGQGLGIPQPNRPRFPPSHRHSRHVAKTLQFNVISWDGL